VLLLLLPLGVNNPMPASLLLFLAFAPLVGTVLLSEQLFGHYFYDVKLGVAAVEIVIFKRFVIFSVPYEEIARFERVSFVQGLFSFSLGLVNRPFGEYILIHRTRGLFRRILVSPGPCDVARLF
jgi:hypothetical protein